MAAGLTVAARIDRLFYEFVDRAAELQFSLGGKRHAALRQLRWNDAVEHIDAAVHALEYVERRADSHQITRQHSRQMLGDELGHVVALAIGFADCESADRQTVEGQLAQKRRALFSKIGKACALNDAEE